MKELYIIKDTPNIIDVPKGRFIAIRGKGDPNSKNGEYQNNLNKLYTIAYTLKMSYKTDYRIKDFFEYVVPPLEGFWWQDGIKGIDYSSKETFNHISLIRIPDFITQKDLDWAKETVLQKKKIDCSDVEIIEYDEGLCVQCLHIGSYDDEPVTKNKMNNYINNLGYEDDITNERYHHEIYLSDPRRVSKDKLKTILRYPIKRK